MHGPIGVAVALTEQAIPPPRPEDHISAVPGLTDSQNAISQCLGASASGRVVYTRLREALAQAASRGYLMTKPTEDDPVKHR